MAKKKLIGLSNGGGLINHGSYTSCCGQIKNTKNKIRQEWNNISIKERKEINNILRETSDKINIIINGVE